MKNQDVFEISEQNRREIDRWIAKFPPEQKRSAVIAALFLVQEQNNHWLSEAAMRAVAQYLELSDIEVFEVATFYDMYDLAPRGTYKIGVCTNISCMLRGAENIVATLEKRLGISLGETTPDGKFTLRELECMAACCQAPMCQINDKNYHGDLTPESTLALIDELEREMA